MFGWTDPHQNIRLPIRTFERFGWADATFQHELTHWALEEGSAFGAARRTVSLLLTIVNALRWDLTSELRPLYTGMHECSFVTHEATATVAGLSYASSFISQDVAEDIADSLDSTYRDCCKRLVPLLDLWDVPHGARARVASFIGLLAMGSDIRRDWSDPTLDLDALMVSLQRHSPDRRFDQIVETLTEHSPLWEQWLACYEKGGRPAVPDCISDLMPCDLPAERTISSVVSLLKCFELRLAKALRNSLKDEADLAASRVVKAAVDAAERDGFSPSNPYWRVSLIPDRAGAQLLRESEVAPDLWADTQLALVNYNDLPHPLPRTTDGRDAFQRRDDLLPGQSEVTLYSGEIALRFIAGDAGQLHSGLNRLGHKSAIVLDATSALRRAFRMVCEAQCILDPAEQDVTPAEFARTIADKQSLVLPGDIAIPVPIGLIFVGCFSDLLAAISPFLDARHPAQAIFMPSALAQRHSASTVLQGLQIGGYGWLGLKLAIPQFPLLYWPTTVMVAEQVFGDRASMKRAGIDVLDQRSFVAFFHPPSEVLPILRLQQYFEESGDPLKTE